MAFAMHRASSSILTLCAIGSLSNVRLGAQAPAGELWLVRETYKVGFERAGATVVPFLGSRAARSWPLALRVESVRSGGEELAFEREAPFRQEGELVSYDRGAFTELYRLSQDAIELAFQLDEVPRGGELVIELALESDLGRWSDEHGLVFAGPDGGLHVGAATVFDGGGRSESVAMELAGNAWTLRVDAGFLAAAEAPLLIDPLITTYAIDDSPADDRAPDLAYDASLGVQVVVWERWFSASDRDVHGQVLDAAGVKVHELVLFASLADEWRAKVAGIEALDRFLVAAVPQPVRVSARTLDLTGGAFVLGPPVSYSREVEQHELGGDGGTVPPHRWALMYHDADGHLCFTGVNGALLLDPDAALVADVTTGADCDYHYDEPRISKRTVEQLTGPRRWALLHRYRDIFGGSPDMGGKWLTIAGTVTTPGNYFDHLVTSTCAITAIPPSTLVGLYRDNSDLYAKVGTAPRVVLAHASAADIDYDGASVIVSYVDAQGVVRAAAYSVDGGTLISTEGAVPISTPGETASSPNIIATSGAATFAERALCAWESAQIDGTYDVDGAVYDSPSAGIRYCTAAPNSVGPGATIHASGSTSIEIDQLTLSAQGCPPNRPGIFYLGQDQIHIPFGEGYRCIGGATRRITPTLTTDASGSVSLLLDFDQPYGDLVLPGAPGINYQFWYVGSSRVDLQACKLEYSIVSPK